jgi:hypothetical protein
MGAGNTGEELMRGYLYFSHWSKVARGGGRTSVGSRTMSDKAEATARGLD